MVPYNSRLPVEIIGHILGYFYDDCVQTPADQINSADRGRPTIVSLRSLLNLRYVGKDWDSAVRPYIFRDIDLRLAFMASSIFKHRFDAFFISGMHCLQRLSISPVFYSSGSEGFVTYEGIKTSLGVHHYPSDVIHMSQIVGLLKMCSESLTDLRFKFIGPVGFDEEAIQSFNHLSNLKVLIICGSQTRHVENDSDSLIGILNRIPSLESLSLNFFALNSLKVDRGSLPNLKHFYFAFNQGNVNAVTEFFGDQGKNITLLEYSPPEDDADQAASALFKLKDSIRALSINEIPILLPHDILMDHFPQLRILKSTCFRTAGTTNWLRWAFFQKVEIFITNYAQSKEHWEEILDLMAANRPAGPISLKHVIFITSFGLTIQDPALVEAFKAQGIRCHFRNKMNYIEILESDTWSKNQITLV